MKQDSDMIIEREFSTGLSDKVRPVMNKIARDIYEKLKEHRDLTGMIDTRQFIEEIKERCKEDIYDKLSDEERGNLLIEQLALAVGMMLSIALAKEHAARAVNDLENHLNELFNAPTVKDPAGRA